MAEKTFVDRGMSPAMTRLVKESMGTGRLNEGKTPAWILLKRADQSTAARLFKGGAVGCMRARGAGTGMLMMVEKVGICTSIACSGVSKGKVGVVSSVVGNCWSVWDMGIRGTDTGKWAKLRGALNPMKI